MKVSIIGSGKVAKFIGHSLLDKGFTISNVYSRTAKNAKALALQLGCSFTNKEKEIDIDADIYIIALTDDAGKQFASRFFRKHALIVHTSGSLGLEAFNTSGSKNTGVIYPLFSFSGKQIQFPKNIPVFIEASNSASEKKIQTIAHALSSSVMKLSSEERFLVHLSAVFANNFTNHLYSISEKILSKRKLSFQILLPMIEQATARLRNESPSETQTGPALRGDKKTLNKHLEFLKTFPEEKKIYKLLSQSIIQSGKKKKNDK